MRPSPAPSRRLAPVVALALAGALVAGACGGLGVGGPRRTLTPPTTPGPATPTVAPTPAAYIEAIEAFVERVAAGDLTYRIEFEGSVRGSADYVPVTGTLVVAGEDFASSFTYDFSVEYRGLLGEYDVAVRAVDGKGWIKRQGKKWAAIKGYDMGDSYVPFKAVRTTADVKYLGETDVGGETRYKLGIPGAVLIHPNTIPYDVRKEKIDSTALEIVIDAKGVPRSGTWDLRGQARIGGGVGQLQRVEMDLDLDFSKVGADLTVEKP